MVLGGGDAVIGQRVVRVGFGADAALMLEGQFEDGIDMTPVRGSLVVPMGQFRTRRHASTSVTRIDEAEAVMRRGISGLGMRRPDGDTFTKIPFTDGNNAVCDRRLGGAVYERGGRRGTRQQYCRAQGHGDKRRPFDHGLAAVDVRSGIRDGFSEQGHDLSPFATASGPRCATGADVIGRLRPRLERSGKQKVNN